MPIAIGGGGAPVCAGCVDEHDTVLRENVSFSRTEAKPTDIVELIFCCLLLNADKGVNVSVFCLPIYMDEVLWKIAMQM
uniref:Uncharacterized protein n=1 Tax=Arundo donax TaxID=35708 RepID=A0A0A9AAP2_ARUDO